MAMARVALFDMVGVGCFQIDDGMCAPIAPMRKGGFREHQNTGQNQAQSQKPPSDHPVRPAVQGSVYPVLALQFPDIGNDALHVSTGQASDRRHVAKAPVVGLNTILNRPLKGLVPVAAVVGISRLTGQLQPWLSASSGAGW